MEGWSSTSIAAYLLWTAVSLAALAAVLLARSRAGSGEKIPIGEFVLAAAFNAAAVILAAFVLGNMPLHIRPEDTWLVSLPFFSYGLAGFAFVRSRVKPKRTALARAIAVYAFSSAGHLTGLTLLLGYLLASARVLGRG